MTMGPKMEEQNSPNVKFIPNNCSDPGDEFNIRTKKWCQRTFTVHLLKQRLPILQWIPHYRLQSAFQDFLAGFTVALTAIPQGIAYGAVAGLPVEYGLYTAFAGPFVYSLLGSVRQVTVGPTAVMALMTHEYVVKGGPHYAILLSFLSGIFELVAGLLNLGWIMDFISGPVISGFCSAAATAVIASQLKSMLGLTFKGSSFGQAICGIFTNWQDIRPWDTLLGLTSILFLIALKNLTAIKKSCFATRFLLDHYVHKVLWFVSTCRNALAVIFGCTVAYLFELYGYQPFRLTGDIKPGLPSFQLPLFSLERPIQNSSYSGNVSNTGVSENFETITFVDMLSDIGSGLIMVPIIAVLEQIAIAKAFSNGKKTDSSQEMIAVGIGSLFCSCFGSFPLTASFSRSSVLAASGGKTQLASFFNGCVILVALGFLMPVFYYIPKSVLAAVIIVAVVALIEVEEILPMWRGRRIELMPFGTTFFCCLFINIEYGILIGIQMHLILLVYEATQSTSDFRTFKKGQNEWIIVKPNQNLFFPCVEHFRDALTKVFNHLQETQMFLNRTVVIDMSLVRKVDHTFLKMLKAMLSSYNKNGFNYVFSNVLPQVEKHLCLILPECTIISNCSELDIPGDEGESLLLEISGLRSNNVPSNEP